MNTISITTSQNIELEYELASLGDRILGYLIDGAILVAYIIIIIASLSFSDSNLPSWTIFLFFLPVFFYSLVSETVMNGQSVGKKVMGMKVVSLSGEQPAFSQYLIRWLFRLVDFSFMSGLVAVVTVAATDKKQRLGDLVAGTIVVKTKPRTTFEHTLYMPTVPAGYVVTYPEVANLKDKDVQLVKEIILAVNKTGNSMLAVQAQEKIEWVLKIKSRSYEPVQFLYTILSDYNYLTSTM